MNIIFLGVCTIILLACAGQVADSCPKTKKKQQKPPEKIPLWYNIMIWLTVIAAIIGGAIIMHLLNLWRT